MIKITPLKLVGCQNYVELVNETNVVSQIESKVDCFLTQITRKEKTDN
ncbi:hypothetical protein [Escherichia phage P817]|nr:hypothetical protein [Escherichia phage P817]